MLIRLESIFRSMHALYTMVTLEMVDRGGLLSYIKTKNKVVFQSAGLLATYRKFAAFYVSFNMCYSNMQLHMLKYLNA